MGDATPNGIDVTTPNIARIYDFFLGGKDNYEADRAAAGEVLKVMPEAPLAARANRAFLTRAVRFLTAQAGIDQFIDIGAGLPTQGNVHEVAQGVTPDARVVYVDNDPVVLTHGRALLEASRTSAVIEGDLRSPEDILADPRLVKLIDFDRPVGLLLVAVLHFVTDDQDPHGLVARLTERLPAGSHLIISHGYRGDMQESSSEHVQGVYRRSNSAAQSRDPDEVTRFFTGFELLEPAVVWVPEWRPDPAESPMPDPSVTHLIGAVGRKP